MMKRVLIILGVAIFACVAVCAGVYHWQTRTPPDEWMGRRLGLSGAEFERFTEAHNQYAITCAKMCEKIRASDARLASIVLSNNEFNPEIESAMAHSDALRNECRQIMLQHFYKVAEMLDARHREAYLQMVLPLIVESDRMLHEMVHP